MSLLLSLGRKDGLAKEVAALSEQNLYACYQCGKCTAGCPVASIMDDPPHQIVRFLQLGDVDKALKSSTPWACVGCLTCASFCPKGVDLARIMEALRTVRLRRLDAPFRYTQEDGEWLSNLPQSAVVAAMRKVTW
jgi:heterodisulfide reductase subunit C